MIVGHDPSLPVDGEAGLGGHGGGRGSDKVARLVLAFVQRAPDGIESPWLLRTSARD
jgi:hypothetical protein